MDSGARVFELNQLKDDIQRGLSECNGLLNLDTSTLNSIEQLFPGPATHSHPLHAINDQQFVEWLQSIGAKMDKDSIATVRAIQ
jgi:hypothetical protein